MEKNEYEKMFRFENDYWWYRGLHELVLHYVEKQKAGKSRQSEPLKIFDAGCGTGRMLELLNRYGTAAGIDYSEEAIALCKKRGLENARIGDLNTWDAPWDSYDIIVSNDVIYISMIEDDMAVVEKFHRALKRDGLLILNLPAFEALRRRHDIAVSGKRRYRKKKTLRQLKEIGFVPVYAGYRLPLLFLVMLAQKHLLDRFRKGEAVSDLKPLPSFINRLLLRLIRLENKMITAGLTLPFGSSLFLVVSHEK